MKLIEAWRRMEPLLAELSARKAILSSEVSRYTEKIDEDSRDAERGDRDLVTKEVIEWVEKASMKVSEVLDKRIHRDEALW